MIENCRRQFSTFSIIFYLLSFILKSAVEASSTALFFVHDPLLCKWSQQPTRLLSVLRTGILAVARILGSPPPSAVSRDFCARPFAVQMVATAYKAVVRASHGHPCYRKDPREPSAFGGFPGLSHPLQGFGFSANSQANLAPMGASHPF